MTREAAAGVALMLCVGSCALAALGLARGPREQMATALCAGMAAFWLAVYLLSS